MAVRVEINQVLVVDGLAPPRHRRGVASMAQHDGAVKL